MKVIYDPDSDTLDIIFKEESPVESDELREGIIIDYNENGQILSIEILDASKHISEPTGIIYEMKSKKPVSA